MLRQFGAFEPASKGELLRRIEKLKVLMADRGIDFAVIIENVNRFYFTGTIQRGMLVIALDCEPLLFIERSVERARLDTPLEVIPIRSDREVRKTLEEKNILQGKGGLELDVLPVAAFERFKNIIGFNDFTDLSVLIKELRIIKSPYELEQIRKSGAIFSPVFVRAKEVIREGVSEVEIEAQLAATARMHGHQGLSRIRGFNMAALPMCVFTGYTTGLASYWDGPISDVGVNPSVPQGSSFNKVMRGIPVLVDCGISYNGYVTDETRVFTVGEMQSIFEKPYEVAREIIEDAERFGREGVNATELFQRAVQLVKKAGLEEHFMGHGEGQVSFIGHGLGLEINELPVITARHGRVLEEGMVFAYEPKFVFPGSGAIGIEVSFIVRKDRLERVSDYPIDIVYL